MSEIYNRLPRTLSARPSQYSVVEGPDMKTSKESTAASEVAATRRQYRPPETWTEWTSERRDLLGIREPRRFQHTAGPDGDAGPVLELPELPSPQREGLKLIDRSRRYEYTLTTHIVPAAWPRSSPDVGYPAGCGPGGLRERWTFSRVRDEMVEMEKRHSRGELPEGKDERQYWVCVNRYVRNRLEETEREGRKRLTLFLTHAIGFGKEASVSGCCIRLHPLTSTQSWEPALLHLLPNLAEEDPIIDEIWSWDAVNHGDSALLNKEKLSSLCNYSFPPLTRG